MSAVFLRLDWLTGVKIAITGALIFWSNMTRAQLTPDSSLGSESSVVIPNVVIKGLPSDRISGGAIRGANLFHSFQQFNVAPKRGVYFTNPQGIENILSRVTGTNSSNILGRLGVLGKANLYLINPNGIVFGGNASLDVQGSFVATTANAIRLGETGLFSASEPASSNLLSINPSALFYNVLAQQAAIVNRSQAGINVPTGQSLFLVGGDVNLESGTINAPGGRVELGGLAAPGAIALGQDGKNLGLTFPDGVERADVLLSKPSRSSKSSEVNVRAAGNGSIAIHARDLTISEGSALRGGIREDSISSSAVAGNITLNATGKIEVTEQGVIENNVTAGAVGKAGEVNINTGSLSMKDGARLNVGTSGNGDGGKVNINALDEIVLDGVKNNSPTSILGNVEVSGKGNAGDISITTGKLVLRNGALLESRTRGRGDGGKLTINASEKASFIGRQGKWNSGAYTRVESSAIGQGGDIFISAGQLLVQNGATVSVSTYGAGNAGNLNINAKNSIQLSSKSGEDASSLLATAEYGSTGTAGNLTITTQNLEIRDGAQVSTGTWGTGKAGAVTVAATDYVRVIGRSPNDELGSSLNTKVFRYATGNGGELKIDTKQLIVQDGAQVSASTFGEGNSGKLTIDATEKVELIGNNSGLFAQANSNATKGAGNLTINTQQLSVRNGARVSVSTFSEGNGGQLFINATEKVELIGDNSRLLAEAYGSTGAAGDITIKTGELLLKDGGIVETSTYGAGKGGNLTVDATEKVELIGIKNRIRSGLLAVARPGSTGAAGNITIKTTELRVENGAEVSAKTFGPGQGGNLTVDGTEKVELVGKNGDDTSGLFSQTENAGAAGNIRINTDKLQVKNGAQILSTTSGAGNAGNISIIARNDVTFNNHAQVFSNVEEKATGNVGNITIEAKSVTLQNEGEIGVRIRGDNQSENNKKGTITISSENLTLGSNALIQGDVDIAGKGRGADINLIATDTIALIGGMGKEETAPTGESTRITLGVLPGGAGSGGNLYIKAGSLIFKDGAIVKASAQGEPESEANAGSITIEANVVDISGSVPESGLPSGIFSSTDTSGNAGDIIVNAHKFKIADGAALSARTKGYGQGGNITVNTDLFEAINGGQLITTTSGTGQAGNIFVDAKNALLISDSDSNYNTRTQRTNNYRNHRNFGLVANDIQNGSKSGLFVSTFGQGTGGDLTIHGRALTLNNGEISAVTEQKGNAGSISINLNGLLSTTDGSITTTAQQSSGGAIAIAAKDIRLFGNSNITTNVGDGAGGGGNITLSANSIIAFNDSDILAFARGGKGGDITLNTPAFFGQNYQPTPTGTDPLTLDGNNRVDINANGSVPGVITLPDTSFIQNSLSELPENPIDTSSLIANSCIARSSRQQEGTFIITGSGGLPSRPGEALMSQYTFGTVRNVSNGSPSANSTRRLWQKGDPIVEPQGVYRLPSAQLVLSRECS